LFVFASTFNITSQPFTQAITTTVILSGQPDWDEWINLIRLRARAGDVWEYVDPSTKQDQLPRLLEPVYPRPSDVKLGTTLYAALLEDEKDELWFVRKRYRLVEKEYKK
jgi:hypothetical protein